MKCIVIILVYMYFAKGFTEIHEDTVRPVRLLFINCQIYNPKFIAQKTQIWRPPFHLRPKFYLFLQWNDLRMNETPFNQISEDEDAIQD